MYHLSSFKLNSLFCDSQHLTLLELYLSHEQVMSAVARLRFAFPHSPIFTRAQSRYEAQELKEAGATEIVVEFDELPRSAQALLLKAEEKTKVDDSVIINV